MNPKKVTVCRLWGPQFGYGNPWFSYDPRMPAGDRCRFFPTWAEAIEYADKIARLS